MNELALLQGLEADANTIPNWYLSASVGAIAGGFFMHWFMNHGPKAKRGLEGLGARRCARYGRSRSGHRVCRKFRAA